MTETTLTLTGVVIPVTLSPGWVNTWGIDNVGAFGPAGASLVGDAFSATFTGDYSIGGEGTVYDANITINGYTFDFGSNIFHTYDIFRDDGPIPYSVVEYQVTDTNGNQLAVDPSLSGGLIDIVIGEQMTQARLFANAVPSPIVGTGASALVAVLFLAFLHRHLRRWGCLYPLFHRGVSS